jgi:hypothetical protein
MEYGGMSLAAASRAVLSRFPAFGPDFEGGFVAVDRTGAVVTPHNSSGMYKAVANSEGLCKVGIWPADSDWLAGDELRKLLTAPAAANGKTKLSATAAVSSVSK